MNDILFDLEKGIMHISKDCIETIGSPKIIAFLINREKRVFGIYACKGHIHSPGFSRARDSIELDEPINGYHHVQCEILLSAISYLCGWKNNLTYKATEEIRHEDRLIFFDLNSACVSDMETVYPTTQCSSIGKILLEKRTSLGLTQKAVADIVGIPQQNYQRFESGARDIRTASFELAYKILNALELSPDALYA